jgi:hypothetical protein
MTKAEQRNNMHAYEDSSIFTFSKKNEFNAKIVIRSQAKRQKKYQKGGQIQDPCCKTKLWREKYTKIMERKIHKQQIILNKFQKNKTN